ncbi:zinc ribbon domain-containing protein [Rhodanobacter sp. AS-Z3]|uniref:FmdB family zinc ribbon protein n=1 Tax=Rhodanobacter sp. AS-Z3 TaxID=3031330 RepID=UPI00247988DA|nr:zinc ribbon domain-containing protein [Rhodanobacter sp. AS-Z3]WEN14840.1 zinc ribbon domain-containing protein [Rhodanobacter sp. AS-Z3]
MPIYEFECSQCGHRFDHLQRLSDADPEVCPACATASLRRRVSAPSFRLAGSGWYETDFKKEGDKKRNLVDGGGAEAKSTAAAPAAAAPAPAATASPGPAASGSAGSSD